MEYAAFINITYLGGHRPSSFATKILDDVNSVFVDLFILRSVKICFR